MTDTSPTDRLARIAQAHSKDHGPGGMTSGDCGECGWPWPCPTFTWATTDRDPTATWDPADDAPEYTPCPAGLLPTGNEPVERCIVEGPHEGHVTATGKRWAADDEGQPR